MSKVSKREALLVFDPSFSKTGKDHYRRIVNKVLTPVESDYFSKWLSKVVKAQKTTVE